MSGYLANECGTHTDWKPTHAGTVHHWRRRKSRSWNGARARKSRLPPPDPTSFGPSFGCFGPSFGKCAAAEAPAQNSQESNVSRWENPQTESGTTIMDIPRKPRTYQHTHLPPNVRWVVPERASASSVLMCPTSWRSPSATSRSVRSTITTGCAATWTPPFSALQFSSHLWSLVVLLSLPSTCRW